MTNKTFQENKESNMDNTNVLAKKRMKRSDIAADSGEKSRAETLKARFKAGSIPLQSDFADLIDMANAGWQATGKDSGQERPGKGMRISSTGQLEPDITSHNFKNDTHGCSPVKVNSDTNGLVIDLHDGLVDTDSGLAVKVGSGIMLSNGAVSIDQEKVLPPGIITMFSGSQVPSGWALCDGTNNTPDLRDRFIVMTGTKFKQGKGEGTTSTDSATAEGSVNVVGTILTSSQIPSHKHTVKLKSFQYSDSDTINHRKLCVLREGSDYQGADSDTYTESIGDGESHTHDATVTNQPHSHTISAIPPYYALAFIMKL